jgi:hypothetical protein
MSIRDEIKTLIGEKRLRYLPSRLKSPHERRTLIITPSLEAVVDPNYFNRLPLDDELRERYAKLRQDLDHFTEGYTVTVAHDPCNKPNNTFLARTHPVKGEIWSIRSWLKGDPREDGKGSGIRVLGRFAERNLFVALEWEFRESLESKDDWGDDWGDKIQETSLNWAVMFRSFGLYQRKVLDEYGSRFELATDNPG